ncbi:MAG: hypothetical protein V1816_14255, partial [Pseudomonadota bacterium]
HSSCAKQVREAKPATQAPESNQIKIHEKRYKYYAKMFNPVVAKEPHPKASGRDPFHAPLQG